MDCLIRYHLIGEEHAAHHGFSEEKPDLETIIQRLMEFLHPEVTYEFLPVKMNGRDTISQLRARMSHARHFLEYYCGLKSFSYRILPDGAPLSQAVWSRLVILQGEEDWSDMPAAPYPMQTGASPYHHDLPAYSEPPRAICSPLRGRRHHGRSLDGPPFPFADERYSL